MSRYPGGKNGAGTYQRIINLIPPHRVYIEPFAGSAAILRHKRPAQASVAIDLDEAAVDELSGTLEGIPGCSIFHGNGIVYLEKYAWVGDEFVYCDPPYLMQTRTSGKMYNEEMTDADHIRLLDVLLWKVPAPVMLSGYKSEMYREALVNWHRIDFQAMTRGGLRNESLWLNYRPPALLHDDSYLGENFRERERIKRKRKRWAAKFEALPVAERGAIYRDLGDVMRSHTATSDAARGSSDAAMPPGSDSPRQK